MEGLLYQALSLARNSIPIGDRVTRPSPSEHDPDGRVGVAGPFTISGNTMNNSRITVNLTT